MSAVFRALWAKVEKELIHQALASHNWNISRSAEKLGRPGTPPVTEKLTAPGPLSHPSATGPTNRIFLFSKSFCAQPSQPQS